MTLTDTTAATQSESISFELDLHHPPDKVWRALTDPALLAQWLLPVVEMKLTPGATFTLQAPPQPGWDGSVHCRMKDVQAQRRISYTWAVGDLDTLVTFELTATASGTRLSIVQTGFKEHQKKNFGGARYGWRLMGGRLVDLLSTRKADVSQDASFS